MIIMYDIIEERGRYVVFIQTPFINIKDCYKVTYDPTMNQVTIHGCASTLVNRHYKSVFPNGDFRYNIVDFRSPQGLHEQRIQLPDYLRDINTENIASYVRENAVIIEFQKLNTLPIRIYECPPSL